MTPSVKNRLKYLRDTERQAVLKFREQLQHALGANLISVKLFGSKATGRAHPGSDIDLLVLVKKYSTHTEDLVIDLAFDVNVEYGLYISPRVIGAATFRHPVWRWTPFLQAVSKEGIAL